MAHECGPQALYSPLGHRGLDLTVIRSGSCPSAELPGLCRRSAQSDGHRSTAGKVAELESRRGETTERTWFSESGGK